MIPCVSSTLEGDCDPSQAQLHLITYLVPNLPLGLFETYQEIFEKAFSGLCSASRLTVDEEQSSPPGNKIDPFTTNEADIGKNKLQRRVMFARINHEMGDIDKNK